MQATTKNIAESVDGIQPSSSEMEKLRIRLDRYCSLDYLIKLG